MTNTFTKPIFGTPSPNFLSRFKVSKFWLVSRGCCCFASWFAVSLRRSYTPKNIPLTFEHERLNAPDQTNQFGDWQIRTTFPQVPLPGRSPRVTWDCRFGLLCRAFTVVFFRCICLPTVRRSYRSGSHLTPDKLMTS